MVNDHKETVSPGHNWAAEQTTLQCLQQQPVAVQTPERQDPNTDVQSYHAMPAVGRAGGEVNGIKTRWAPFSKS